MKPQDLVALGIVVGRDTTIPKTELAYRLVSLLRDARRLHRLDELHANGDLDGDQHDHRKRPIERRIARTCEELGCGFGFVRNQDPRGASLYLTIPSGFTDDWGNRGITLY